MTDHENHGADHATAETTASDPQTKATDTATTNATEATTPPPTAADLRARQFEIEIMATEAAIGNELDGNDLNGGLEAEDVPVSDIEVNDGIDDLLLLIMRGGRVAAVVNDAEKVGDADDLGDAVQIDGLSDEDVERLAAEGVDVEFSPDSPVVYQTGGEGAEEGVIEDGEFEAEFSAAAPELQEKLAAADVALVDLDNPQYAINTVKALLEDSKNAFKAGKINLRLREEFIYLLLRKQQISGRFDTLQQILESDRDCEYLNAYRKLSFTPKQSEKFIVPGHYTERMTGGTRSVPFADIPIEFPDFGGKPDREPVDPDIDEEE